MDSDLVKRLTERIAQWRAEARDLHRRGFDFEGSTLSACAHELEQDLRSTNIQDMKIDDGPRP